jgi:DNA processing protein
MELPRKESRCWSYLAERVRFRHCGHELGRVMLAPMAKKRQPIDELIDAHIWMRRRPNRGTFYGVQSGAAQSNNRGPSMDIAEYETVTPADILGPLNSVEEKFAPKQLFLRGDRGLLRSGPRVSIVGTRKASADGRRRAQSLAKTLANHGIVVVSGLAAGIDRAAHEAAIEAGGRTIAVIGTPLDQSYPKENADLQETIARDHLLISQFPIGYPSLPKNFPLRNRTMALVTDATVIVEAGEQSGTLHQGWEALRLGRILFLMESVADDDALSWPKEMISYGAQVLNRENLGAVIENLPAFTSTATIAAEA